MAAPTTSQTMGRAWKIIPAPRWLVRRMETLRRMPPSTLEEVAAQIKASAEFRKKLISKQTV